MYYWTTKEELNLRGDKILSYALDVVTLHTL